MTDPNASLALWLNFAGICVLALVSLRNGSKIADVHTIVNSQRTAMELLINQQREKLVAQQQALHDAGAIVPGTDTGKASL
jgi:hypothetical protein